MFHFLGFIIFFILIVLTIGFVILWRIVHTFMGIGKRMTGNGTSSSQHTQRATYQRPQNDSDWSEQSTQSSTSSRQSDKKKVFDDDEGEYVEFEEIKD